MKLLKPLLWSTIISSVLAFSIIACKKNEQTLQSTATPKGSTIVSPMGRFQDSISVSSYGFLVFPSLDNLDDYRAFVLSSTHSEVQEYLNRIGFTSLGDSLYGSEYSSDTVTEEQSVNYILNSNEIFQVENAIMKPIGETSGEIKWQFLLVMTPENLSGSSYENLVAGTFDENSMDKFATNPDDESLNLFEFIQENPTGYEETVPNSPEPRRPMFGVIFTPETICEKQPQYNPGTGNCERFCKDVVHKTSYIFWIGFHHPDQTISSYAIPATGC